MQPDDMGVMVLEFQQPVYPGFQVSACSAAAQQVVYGHLSISDKNDAVIPEEIFQNPLCLHSAGQGQRQGPYRPDFQAGCENRRFSDL